MILLIYSYSFVIAFISRKTSLEARLSLFFFSLLCFLNFRRNILARLQSFGISEPLKFDRDCITAGASRYYPPTGLTGSRRLSPRQFKTGATTRHSLIRFVCREFVGERIFHSPEIANVDSRITSQAYENERDEIGVLEKCQSVRCSDALQHPFP